MKVMAKVFVSYTRRDGKVTLDKLQALYDHLDGVCIPFIHIISAPIGCFQQFAVLKALLRAHMVILVESPMVHKSPWVRLELFLSHLKLMPVLKISESDLYVNRDLPQLKALLDI